MLYAQITEGMTFFGREITLEGTQNQNQWNTGIDDVDGENGRNDILELFVNVREFYILSGDD